MKCLSSGCCSCSIISSYTVKWRRTKPIHTNTHTHTTDINGQCYAYSSLHVDSKVNFATRWQIPGAHWLSLSKLLHINASIDDSAVNIVLVLLLLLLGYLLFLYQMGDWNHKRQIEFEVGILRRGGGKNCRSTSEMFLCILEHVKATDIKWKYFLYANLRRTPYFTYCTKYDLYISINITKKT